MFKEHGVYGVGSTRQLQAPKTSSGQKIAAVSILRIFIYSSIKIMQLIEQTFTNFKFYRETAEQHIAVFCTYRSFKFSEFRSYSRYIQLGLNISEATCCIKTTSFPKLTQRYYAGINRKYSSSTCRRAEFSSEHLRDHRREPHPAARQRGSLFKSRVQNLG